MSTSIGCSCSRAGEAVNRTLRHRLAFWKAGHFQRLWQRLCDDHRTRSTQAKKQEQKQVEREARRVAKLVDDGLLSRAAAQLCSRGIAPHNANTAVKVGTLFPSIRANLGDDLPEAPSFSVAPDSVRKLVLQTPKGLAPGCSGLRAEYLKALLCDRNAGLAAQSLSLLKAFVNQSLNGYLPRDLQPYVWRSTHTFNQEGWGCTPISGGRISASAHLKMRVGGSHPTALPDPSHQIGAGRAGPVIPAAVQTTKSWYALCRPARLS